MTHAPRQSVIGVDGGGTRCRFALLGPSGRVEIERGSANVASDRAGALATLTEGLAALWSKAGLAPDGLQDCPTFLGLAGVVDTDDARNIASALPLDQVRVEDDRRTAFVGALGAADGCVVGLGTGSFFGRRADGHTRLIGGWGFELADEASGAWLGRALLRRTLSTRDGLAEPSTLTDATLSDLRGARGIVAFAKTAAPADFAAFAPRIVAAAAAGDAQGTALMKSGAAVISEHLDHLGWRAGEPICPIGGLAPHYAPFLPREIADYLTPPKGSALDGALMLAADFARMGELA